MKIHVIRFRKDVTLDLVQPTEEGMFRNQMEVVKGDTALVDVKPYTQRGREKCDLMFRDGTFAIAVGYDAFQFVDLRLVNSEDG